MPARKSDNPLEELFAETLKDIYFAEKQILRALPKMAKVRKEYADWLKTDEDRQAEGKQK